jgi:hypothetical protein
VFEGLEGRRVDRKEGGWGRWRMGGREDVKEGLW